MGNNSFKVNLVYAEIKVMEMRYAWLRSGGKPRGTNNLLLLISLTVYIKSTRAHLIDFFSRHLVQGAHLVMLVCSLKQVHMYTTWPPAWVPGCLEEVQIAFLTFSESGSALPKPFFYQTFAGEKNKIPCRQGPTHFEYMHFGAFALRKITLWQL